MTTPNFGWPLIQPTDLVTDLPADFEAFADAVDATVDGIDNRLTDLEVITTEGDLIVGNATGDPVRVAVGTAGQVLASDGDTVEWVAVPAPDASYSLLNAGGTALTGAAIITVSFSAKNKIFAVCDGGTTGSAALIDFSWRVNGDTTSANYRSAGLKAEGSPLGIAAVNIAGTFEFQAFGTGNSVSSVGHSFINILNADSTVDAKPTIVSGSAGFGEAKSFSYTGIYKGTSAITSLAIRSLSGNFTGGTIYVYGAN